MQIMLNQDEIEEAIRNHVLSQLAIREDQEISIDLRAGRGENGFTATLDVRPREGERGGPKPAFTKGDEVKQGPRLVQAETNVTKEKADTPHYDPESEARSDVPIPAKEDKIGISTQKASDPKRTAASKTQATGIFATAPKTSPNAAPEPTEDPDPEDTEIAGGTGPETEPEPVPDEPVTAAAAADDTQEDAQDGSEAPAEQPETKKSIFSFAPKKSAG